MIYFDWREFMDKYGKTEFSLISPPLDPIPADTRMVLHGAFDSEVIRVGTASIDTPLFDRLASSVFASRDRDEW